MQIKISNYDVTEHSDHPDLLLKYSKTLRGLYLPLVCATYIYMLARAVGRKAQNPKAVLFLVNVGRRPARSEKP